MTNPRFVTLVLMILAAAASRFIPHPYNFTPIGAMALFGGAYLNDRRLALGIPLAAMLVSDAILGFHATMPFVYLGFAIMVGLGWALRENRRAMPIFGASLSGALLFFVLTNFGTWVTGNMYPHNWEGLVACYVAAIPFFHNTILGNLAYAAMLFGGFAWFEKSVPALQDHLGVNRVRNQNS